MLGPARLTSTLSSTPTTSRTEGTMHSHLNSINFVDELRHEARRGNLEIQAHWRGLGLATIDEMSLLFAGDAQRGYYEGLLAGSGWELFDHTKDSIVCETPGAYRNEDFRVEFKFWRHPDERWRIESMIKLGGHNASPLHDHALAITKGEPAIIHASFKLPTEAQYERAITGQRTMPTLSYRNSYGRFSYFGWLPPYIKPRVNLRDQ